MVYKVRNNLPDDVLRKSVKHKFSRGELTLRLVAYMHGLNHDAFRKHLTTARKECPALDKLGRQNGTKMIESK